MKKHYSSGQKLHSECFWTYLEDRGMVYPENSKKGKRQALFKCICGFEKVILIESVKRGQNKSCGCKRFGRRVGNTTKTHGLSKTREYKTWYAMVNRCYDKNHEFFNHYGGRGIKVCDRWLGDNGLNNFIENMGKKPKNHSLDRINNNLGYSPENCRWTNQSTQMYNRRKPKNNTSGIVGVCKRKSTGNWEVKIKKDKVSYSLGSFDNLEDAKKARQLGELEHYGFVVTE